MQVQRRIIDVHGTQVLLELPESFVNHLVEVIALTVDEDAAPSGQRRQPSSAIFGRGRTLGDLISPVVDPEDWSVAT